jgi:MFS family permease
MIITFFLCMDQSILAPNLSDIARDFNMTDIEKDTKLGGELSLSFFIVAAPASLITGYYADRVNRKNLFTAIILFGEVGCLICYWVEEYWQLLVLRLMTGIAGGGSGVLVASLIGECLSNVCSVRIYISEYLLSLYLIGDMYPPEERPRANMYAGIPSRVVLYYNQLPPLRNCNTTKQISV